jgi:hypothetical protein
MFGFMFGWIVFCTLLGFLFLFMDNRVSIKDTKSMVMLATAFYVIFVIAVIAGMWY